MSQQRVETPEDLIRYQLRSTLTMEEHSLEALQDLEGAARDKKFKTLFFTPPGRNSGTDRKPLASV